MSLLKPERYILSLSAYVDGSSWQSTVELLQRYAKEKYNNAVKNTAENQRRFSAIIVASQDGSIGSKEFEQWFKGFASHAIIKEYGYR